MTVPAADPTGPAPESTTGPADPPADPQAQPDTDPGTGTGTDARAAEVAKLRRENAAWRTKLRATEERLSGLEAQHQTDAEKALAQARAEAASETATKFQQRLLAAQVRTIAAELRFRDPADAGRLVDLEEIQVGPDGEIDGEALRAALKTVAEAKPYLIEEATPRIPTAREAGLGMAGAPDTDYTGYSVADFDKEFYGTGH